MEAFAHDMQKRLQGLYTAQSMFADDNAARKISDLIPALIKPFAGQIDIVHVGALTDALVDRGQADAIGLVLAELTVNSVKHGALRNGGKIDIHAVSVEAVSRIVWTESLTEAVKQQSCTEGQGLTLIAQIVGSRSGVLDISWSDFGLTVTLEFPLVVE
jgi:two-component sensor histidine kinase